MALALTTSTSHVMPCSPQKSIVSWISVIPPTIDPVTELGRLVAARPGLDRAVALS